MTECEDFSDTAALMANLDLIISVDTAIAHVAGALGKPVWLLNRFDICWRWMRGRDDSPWYPTMRLFRQPRPGDWGGALCWLNMSFETRSHREDGGLVDSNVEKAYIVSYCV